MGPLEEEVSLVWKLGYNWGAGNRAQWVKKLAAKPGNLSQSPRSMQWKEKKNHAVDPSIVCSM